ncbi:MAG: hypothetical protein V1867_08220 [Candidatus Falkowbacteria bacterium]
MSVKYFKKINYIIIASMLFLPAGTRAFNLDDLLAEYDEVYYYDDSGGAKITNNIKSSASSGGNTAKNGAVVEGKTRGEIEIETEINGTKVTDVKIEKETEDSVQLKIENRVNADSDKAEAEISDTPPASASLQHPPLIRGGTGRGIAEPVLGELWEEPEEPAGNGLCALEESDCADDAGNAAEDDRSDDNRGIAAVWSGFIGAIKAGILKILGFWG